MTTLASAVSIGDNQLLIDAPMSAGQIPGWVKIDSELLNVGGQHFRTGTTLVLTDPATATHSQGATVTYAGRPYNAAFLAATAGEGGGGAIAATDGQIVFMDGAEAVGHADLTWGDEAAPGEFDPAPFLGLGSGENETVHIFAKGIGTQMAILAADGDATHVGGEITLESGGSDGQGGGQLNIKAGNDGGGGDGGPLVISSGSAAAGTSGDIDIKVAGGAGSGVGGNVNITAGQGTTGNGGDVLIQAGDKLTGGSHGSVTIYEGSAANSIELNASGVFVIGGLITFDSLPTADPTNAGQLWNDAGTLKVSAG